MSKGGRVRDEDFQCEECGELGIATRKDARFCSAACRVKAHRKRNKKTVTDKPRMRGYDIRKERERLLFKLGKVVDNMKLGKYDNIAHATSFVEEVWSDLQDLEYIT
jgi:hypothetical protein